MPKRSSTLAVAGGLVAAVIVGTVAVSSAQATNDPQAHHRVIVGGAAAYTVEGIEAEWPSLVADFPGRLPADVSFPDRPFEFFYPESGPDGEAVGETYFEDGLAESLLARYWRCSWLDASVTSTIRGDHRAADAAANQLLKFETLPGARGIDVSAYTNAITREAGRVGLTAQQYEYELECGFYESEGED